MRMKLKTIEQLKKEFNPTKNGTSLVFEKPAFWYLNESMMFVFGRIVDAHKCGIHKGIRFYTIAETGGTYPEFWFENEYDKMKKSMEFDESEFEI